LALLGLLFSAAALAHVHLQGSSPADGSQLESAPATLVLSFSEAAQLTALSLELPGGALRKLSIPEAAATRVSVALPQLGPGEYRIHWRALSRDGHVVPGEIRFRVGP
jgi:methionine-rich copper-binding protein CopC